MTHLTLELSETLERFVEDQVAEGGYESPGAYLQDILEKARRRRDKEQLAIRLFNGEDVARPEEMPEAEWEQLKERVQTRLEELLLEGINSGPPIEANQQYWKEKRARLAERLEAARGS